MKYLDERVEVMLRDLKKLMIKDEVMIENWEIKDGYYVDVKEAYEKQDDFRNFNIDTDFFRGVDKHYWFRTKFSIPNKFQNKTLWLTVKTGIEGGGCQNPQFLLFINDKIVQGMDTKHEESRIIEKVKEKDLKIDLQVHTGYFSKDLKLYTSVFVLDEKIKDFYYDLFVPLMAFRWLDKDNLDRIKLSYHMNEAINLVDMRNPYTTEFYESLDKALLYLRKNIYEDMAGFCDIVASCIGHTHIDVAWRWTVSQTREKVSRSFSTVAKLMEEYDNYKFMSSQPILYKFLKLRYKEIYDKVKKLVKEKRWEPEGGTLVEMDTNLPSGESLIRQFHYGQKFFRDEFSIEKSNILWLPDAFGYSGNLPQIMKKCNIKYFMTTKLAWNQYNKIPNDTFMWQGIDGSEILTYLISTTELKQNKENYFTTYNGMLHPDAIMGGWNRYQNKNINNDILISYGYGDGGGGPTREMLEVSKRMEKGIKSIPMVKQRFANEFFKDLEKRVLNNKRLEKWVGELYFEYHRGTLSSMGRNKRDNRRVEIELMELEFLALLSDLDYPQKELDEIWETVLVNQFHDILPGSSIKEVYDVTKVEYEEIFKKLKELRDKYIKIENSEGITLINNLSFERDDYVDLKEIIGNKSGYLGDNIVQNGISFVRNIPSKGYISLNFNENTIEDSNISFKDNIIESRYYILEFDENYNFKRIYDKLNDRELVESTKLANRLVMYEDKPMWHDNWDIDEYYTEKSYKLDKFDNAYVLENGPLYMIFRIERSISNSKITQDIYIYHNSRRIDFKNVIDWKDSQHLLKVHFPVNIHSNYASYDIQFGNLKRPTHKNTSWDRARFEVCAHKWVDISDEDYGFALLNNCKYGHSVNENDIALTLIKAGIEPNQKADIEMHYITYSIFPHENSLAKSDVVRQGYMLNHKLRAIKGTISEKYSYLSVDKKNIIVETIKKSYDNKGSIIRIYESSGAYTKFNLKVNQKYNKAYLVDAMENIIRVIDLNEEIIIKSFEFITIKLED